MEETEFKAALDKVGEQLQEIYLEENRMEVHFSAGYVYGETLLQDDLRLMLPQADELLYKAKGTGKNNYIGEEYQREYALSIQKKEEEAFRRG